MSATGETDLATLLATLRPALLDGEFVFVSLPAEAAAAHLAAAFAMVREEEGVSLVLRAAYARACGVWRGGATFRCVTCRVHSSLEAVGMTAAMAAALAARGIPANVIAGALHDHLFVPAGRADDAVAVLSALGDPRARGGTMGGAPAAG
ncbi:ACT domain-containing protein [Roseisolibacter sp. H3M3-2]|uniref:ACT domain-containing protein n=1 Tax=Roseisolibacter sp. H3M3-2 TaxID=3031323 RepID=UPI0023DC487C|nr:ACT domain-containing protein [Roseisolibacter sp. H3M3-2]MDF1501610.1 ACT domain-containing protein [Roseisolibacter sp. H3M3-2]